MNRTLSRVVLKSTSGSPEWDTGLTLVLKTDEGSPVTVGTATETATGFYRVTFTSVEKWGFWYVGTTKKSDWGQVWLGSEPSAPSANSILAINAAGTDRTAIALSASAFLVTDSTGALTTSTKIGLSTDTAQDLLQFSGVASSKGAGLELAAYTAKTATIKLYSGAIGTANLRWQFGKDATAESGANAGSDFLVVAYSDAGASLGNALRIYRSNLMSYFGGPVVSTSYLQGTYLELSSDLYLRANVYARNKANSAWLSLLNRDTSAAETRFGLNYISQAIINAYVVGGAEQIVLRLGNFTDSTTAQHDIITEDAGEQSLIVRSNRWQGGMLWRRGGSAGWMKTAHLWSNESTSAWFELYTKGPSTQTVHSKLDEGTWTMTPASGAAQLLMKVATYSTSGVAVQCDSATGNLVLNTLDSRPIIFKTQNVQRAQIAAGGQFCFATTSTTHGFTFGDGQTIGSATYQTGIFGGGFRLEHNSSLTNQSRLEIDNIMVRGSLRVHIFQKDIVRATNGYLFISDATTATNAVAITGSGPWQIPLKESVFQVGDLLWIKDIDESGGGLTVLSVFLEVTDDTTPAAPWVDWVSGDWPATIKSGMTIVRIGNTSNTARQGSIFFDASGDNPPYMDIYDGRDSINAVAPKVRLGKLTGITDSAFGGSLSGYGLYTQNGFFKGNVVVASTTAIALATYTIAIGNVTGTGQNAIKLTNTGTPSTSGLFAYDEYSAEVFALRCDGTAQIGGWYFSSDKLYNSRARLESTSSLRGLGIESSLGSGFDAVRVGEFTSGAPSDTAFPLTAQTFTIGDLESWSSSTVVSGWTFAHGAGLQILQSSNGVSYHGSWSAAIEPLGNSGVYATMSTTSSLTMTNLTGKTVRVSFWVMTSDENSDGSTDLLANCTAAVQIDSLEVKRSSFTLPAEGTGWAQRYIDVDVPADASTMIVELRFEDTAPSGKAFAWVFCDYVQISTFEVASVQLSQKGLEIWASPTTRFKIAAGFEAVLPSLVLNNYLYLGSKWKIRHNPYTNVLEFLYNGTVVSQVTTGGAWQDI